MSSGRTGSSQTSLTSQSDPTVTSAGSPEKERPTLRVHLPTGCQLVKYSENTDVKVSTGEEKLVDLFTELEHILERTQETVLNNG